MHLVATNLKYNLYIYRFDCFSMCKWTSMKIICVNYSVVYCSILISICLSLTKTLLIKHQTMSVNYIISFLIIVVLKAIKSEQELSSYPFSTWMNSLSTEIASKTIFEITFPGANKAAMSFTWNIKSLDTFSPYANDQFTQSIQTLNDIQQQRDWAQTQKLQIYEMLMSGIRFLDLQFEFDGISTYYGHNGIYGLTVQQVLDDINQFIISQIDNMPNEIIILYLNDFTTRLNLSNDNEELQNLFDIIIQHSIGSYIIKSNVYDIKSENIKSLTSNNKHIIIFSDKFPTSTDTFNDWFYSSNEYFNIALNPDQYEKPNITDTLSESQSIILNNLRYGWNKNTLNLIYWIPLLSDIFHEKYLYLDYFVFNAPFSQQLHPFINRYPKLWFANVLLANFIESSDIVQQAIVLNLKYSKCNDNYNYNCSTKTNLFNQFSDNNISPKCQNNVELSSQCIRSCGLCPIQSQYRYPGDKCITDSDCNGEIYNIFTNKQIGICGSTPIIWNESYCLSVSPQQSCLKYFDTSSYDQCMDTNLSQCHESCAANYDCMDEGYCHSTYSVCMSYNLSDFTTFASSLLFPLLRYWGVASHDAASVLSNLEPLRPGNSSAPYTSTTGEQSDCNTDSGGEVIGCVFDNVAVSPYMTSVIGLMMIPLILSILLCVCYCCLWPWWCFCEDWSKENCCHKCCAKCYDENTKRCFCDKDPLKCIGTPEDSPWIHWIPCVVLGIAVVISLWATIDGLVSNSEIHEVVFDEPDSLQVSTDTFLTEIVDRLSAVEPSASYIVSNALFVLESTLLIIKKTYDVEDKVDEMNNNLNILRTNYVNNVDLTATVINPFTVDSSSPVTTQFTIICEKCESISDEALDVQDEFDKIVAGALRLLVTTIQKFEPLYDIRQLIKEHASYLFEDLDGVITTIQQQQDAISEFFETASDLDSQLNFLLYVQICLVV